MSGIEFRVSKPSGGIGSSVVSGSRSTAGALSFLMLMPGLTACMFARMKYQLLDDGVALGLMIGLFLLPFLVQVALIVRKRSNRGLLRIIYACSGCGLGVLALLLFLNGGMDNSPQTVMRASVIRKAVITGRHGAVQYHLIVTSWRAGKSSEDVNVGPRVFSRAAVGRNVAIEVHRGYFNLPWSGKVFAE